MKQINELVQLSHASISSSSDCQSTNSSWIQGSSKQSPNPLNIPSSLVAPKRQRRSTDHSKVVVKTYKNAPQETGAVLTHFKALSYKPQKRLRKKKKADPKLVDFLWRQIDSAAIHAVSVFGDCQESNGWCCATNKHHAGHHHFACVNHKSSKSSKKAQDFVNPSSSSSNEEEGKKIRTAIAIRELLL